MTARPAPTGTLDLMVLAILLLLASILLGNHALQIFDFYDMSMFMDAGYRVYLGQEPYLDFFFISGPIHLYMIALSYLFFGFGKTAVLAHLLTINAIVLTAVFWIARQHLNLLLSLVVTALTAFCFYGPIAHPWYDQNAFFWLILAVLLLELFVLRRQNRGAPAIALVCGVLAALSFLTKLNIGMAGTVVLFATFLTLPRRGRLIVAYGGGVLFTLLLFLALLEAPARFFDQAFFAYNTEGRMALLNAAKFWFILRALPYSYLMAFTGLVALLGGRSFVTRNKTRLVLAMGLLSTSIFAAFSGSMLPQSNIALLGIEILYIFQLVSQLPRKGPARLRLFRIAGTLSGLACMYCFIHAVDMARSSFTWRWKASNHQTDYVLQNEALRGWKAHRSIGEGVDRSAAYIRQNVPTQESLFIFPDVQIIYGLTGHRSYPKVPWCFWLGTSPPPGHLYREFRAHFMANPPRWILLHDQREVSEVDTRSLLRWLKLDSHIREHYRPRWQWGDFHLLHHEKEP